MKLSLLEAEEMMEVLQMPVTLWCLNIQIVVGLNGNDIDGEAENDYSSNSYGISLSSNGKVVAIGAPNDGNGTNSGHVSIQVFQ